MKIVVMARQKARGKRVWAILRFFTQFGFIVFTYLAANKLIEFSVLLLTPDKGRRHCAPTSCYNQVLKGNFPKNEFTKYYNRIYALTRFPKYVT